MSTDKPPIVIDCAQVFCYAIVDKSITYVERGNLFVDGKLLGAVPRLAICRNLDEKEFIILHCHNDWNALGISGGYTSVAKTKRSLERSYSGLLKKWVDTGYTRPQAVAYLENEFKNEKCSFCGRWPIDVEIMIGEDVRICNHCIDKFHKIIHEPNKVT
jgi:hypothetical protein